MKPSPIVILLALLVAALATVGAAAGLFWPAAGAPFAFTSVRGEMVMMYGHGLYRYETLRDGTGFKGVDLFTLVMGVPLLLWATLLYRRASLRGGLLLAGTLGYFAYNAASMTFGYAYNNLFLVYLAQFSAALFALLLALLSFDLSALPTHVAVDLPRRGIAGFLFAVGGSLILVWVGLDILPALLQGKAPALNGHTTLPTHALDVGIVAPLAFLAGGLLLRRTPLGILLAAVMVILSAVLGTGVLALSAAQLLAGVVTTNETVIFVVPFVILTLIALWFAVVLFRHVAETAIVSANMAIVQAAILWLL